jgi:hypothetical protein
VLKKLPDGSWKVFRAWGSLNELQLELTGTSQDKRMKPDEARGGGAAGQWRVARENASGLVIVARRAKRKDR